MWILQARHALRLGICALIVVSSPSSSALAQLDGSWSCDASNGGAQDFETPVSPHVRAITGQMLFRSRDFTGSDIPSAHIAFSDSASGPDPEHCHCKGIRAQIFPEEPDTVKFYFVRNGHAVGMAQGPVGTPITFGFVIDDSGTMIARIGRTNPLFKSERLINPKRDRVHVTCSSADVQFLNVRVQ